MSGLQGIRDPAELALLSQQKMTNAPQHVFDASQFKVAVNRDVSANVIESLQRKFGDDMAGAIDKFLDVEQKTSNEPVELHSDETPVKAQDVDLNVDLNVDSVGRKAFIVRDRFWDKAKRQYVIQKPAKPRTESKKSKKPVILVRRDYEENMLDFTTALVISGTVLRNALRHIFRGAAGFTLTESDSTETTPKFMLWARHELEMLAEHYRSMEDGKSAFEIESALSFVAAEFEELLEVIPTLLPHSITFEYLWAILPPDCLVVGKDNLNFHCIWCVRSHSTQRMQDGVFLVMDAEYLMWDGSRVGKVETSLRIPLFAGVKLISDLPYIPLKYHPEREEIIENVRERSKRALTFWTPGFRHLEHNGTGMAEVYDKVEPYPFSGRVIIDPKMMQQMQPANKVMPRTWAINEPRTVSRTCVSDLTMDEQKPEILAVLISGAGKTTPDQDSQAPTRITRMRKAKLATRYTNGAHPSGLNNDSTETPPPELTDVQTLLVSGHLYGYSLREGKWGAFAVDRVAPIVWNSTIFSSLVLEPSLKDTIYRLVTAHTLDTTTFDDFVTGKGRGLIGLFFGPPGAGKTLTAEAIAETGKMPLYAVSSGALGHEATQIHERLSVILKLAAHWKAVLLLDEADVFLAQRRVEDIERNAIVSIFLRELEYYGGILLLTTNQVEVIDEAFQSRIHLLLRYPSLDAPARLKIWKNFVGIARESKGIIVEVEERELEELAKIPLNGRQIKNTVSIAVKIATTTESHKLTAESFNDTVRLLQNSPF
ncbi:P-loop containing nucleoside triphosphate hydrolase protein [Karstenula rhodostoma CBS 690.94]|uniref:P-loop containing nucleoside triphosphate hydrolase protein n=1 Tax=Karstenula rhodostoma CBS 690.94 TaxID=1392251 RepID=A0A9P4PSA7_9PLEO|nr:P-loop containing nucleoside triphosphate hydrolase protein [Karstenula rhodostoma CBS 690.94]